MTKQAQPAPKTFPGPKRYRALVPMLREKYGERVQRVSLDAGFTCPNRDGTISEGGCLYCDAGGARPKYVVPEQSIADQLQRGIKMVSKRHQANLFIAYFQAFTNTYAAPQHLREVYRQGLSDSRVVAMSIGTRPDCLGNDVLDVLEEIAQDTFLWVEVGLQTTNNDTLRTMNRGHDVTTFVDATERLQARGIRVLSHVLAGLPGDTQDDTIAAATLLTRLGVWGVKIHNLYIDEHSSLADLYHRGEIRILERQEYLETLIAFLRHLSPETIIDRVLGQAPPSRLLAPRWALQKTKFLADLDLNMEKQNAWQGDKCP